MTGIPPEVLVNFVAAIFLCMADQGLINEGQAVSRMRNQLNAVGLTSMQINNYSAKEINEIISQSGGCVTMVKDMPGLLKEGSLLLPLISP